MNWRKIRLLPVNPRFTLMKDLDWKKIGNNKEEIYTNYNLIDNIRHLLKFEDDFSDFLELLNSVIENGWDKYSKIFIIKGQDGYFYCVEGNRRLMVLNLISDFYSFNKNDQYKIEEAFNNEKLAFDKMKDFISKFKGDVPIDINIESLELPKNEDEVIEIWRTINSKHVGEEVGKRIHSRFKYFFDLMNYVEKLKNEKNNNNQIIQKSSLIFNKKKEIIQLDIKNGLWIMYVTNIYNNSKNDKKIQDKINFTNMKISSLELLPTQNIKFNDNNERISNILDLKWDLQNIKLTIKNQEINQEEVLIFLVNQCLNKKITTRGIKPELYDDLSSLFYKEVFKTENHKDYIKKLKQQKTKTKTEKQEIEITDNIKEIQKMSLKINFNNKDNNLIWSIKYLWKYDLVTLDALSIIDKNGYPYSTLSLILRTTIENFLLLLIYMDEFAYKYIYNLYQNLNDENMIKIWDKYNSVINNRNDFGLAEPLVKSNYKLLVKKIDSCNSKVNKNLKTLLRIFLKNKFLNWKDISKILENSPNITQKYNSKILDSINSLLPTLQKELFDENLFAILNKLVHTPHYLRSNKNEIIDACARTFGLIKEVLKFFSIIIIE